MIVTSEFTLQHEQCKHMIRLSAKASCGQGFKKTARYNLDTNLKLTKLAALKMCGMPAKKTEVNNVRWLLTSLSGLHIQNCVPMGQ